MIHLLVALAFAEDPVPAAVETVAPPIPPIEADLVPPATGAELVDEAWRRIDLHDYEGARIVAEEAIRREDDAKVRAIVALGAAWELDGGYETALGRYEEARRLGLAGELAEHVTFRVAETNAALGRYAAAFAELATLGEPESRPYLDGKKLHLTRGVWRLESGAREEGIAEIEAALDGIGVDEVTWYQARARAALATDLCAQANGIEFPEKDKKAAKALKQRTALILTAEEHVVATLKLKEPEWGLQGLLVLGQAYEGVADDLVASPVPKKLKTDEQRALYVSTVKERADLLLVKASRYYGEGIDVATRLSWTSPRVARLEAAHAAVKAKLAPPPVP